MKKLLISGLFGIVFALGATEAEAQDRLLFKVGYNTGMPVGSFKDNMSKNSFRGFLGELSYPVNERLKVGLGVSFNDYYEKLSRQFYSFDEGTVSAVLSNSIQTTPITFKAQYELTKSGWIRPYAGIGAGFNLIGYSKYYGEFGTKKTAFKPTAGAEAGINIPFNRETRISGITLGGHFNYMPFKADGLSDLNNWGLHAAVYFPLK